MGIEDQLLFFEFLHQGRHHCEDSPSQPFQFFGGGEGSHDRGITADTGIGQILESSELKFKSLAFSVGERGKFLLVAAFDGNPYVEKGESSQISGIVLIGTYQDAVRLKDEEIPFSAEVIE